MHYRASLSDLHPEKIFNSRFHNLAKQRFRLRIKARGSANKSRFQIKMRKLMMLAIGNKENKIIEERLVKNTCR